MIENGQRDQVIQGLTFKLTCEAFPEQYDVFDERGQKVAYVRLRHSQLQLSNAENTQDWWQTFEWDTAFPKEKQLKGYACFDDDEERTYFLNFIASIIHKKLQNPTWEVWQENGLLKAFDKDLE